jgi:hypothetical protein
MFIAPFVTGMKLRFGRSQNWIASRCRKQSTGILRNYRVHMLIAKKFHQSEASLQI